jgi:addiction module HigA family antidote
MQSNWHGRMKPLHPGELFKRVLERMEISLEEFSDATQTPIELNESFTRGELDIGEPMAEILSWFFKTTEDIWLNAQRNYDAWMEANVKT